MSTPLLTVQNLAVHYRLPRSLFAHARLTALHAISFELRAGSALGVVGESGSGKSSLARALMRLIPAEGKVLLDGIDLLQLDEAALRPLRRHMQMIYQDPSASLDPQMRVEDIVAEPLREFHPQWNRAARRDRVVATLGEVGLGPEFLARFPHEFSGGQAQRVAIARALILDPRLLVCDEPMSALDVSIKAQISNLLKDLRQRRKLTLLFISHDLPAVRFGCDRVLVLYLGRVMELATTEQLLRNPIHPYSRALLQSVPSAVPRSAAPLTGELPSPLAPPCGCVFRTRCPLAISRCAAELPALRCINGTWVACHRAEETIQGAEA